MDWGRDVAMRALPNSNRVMGAESILDQKGKVRMAKMMP